MSKTHAEIRFEKARKRLSDALSDLEKTTKKKLQEDVVDSKIFDVTAADSQRSQAKLIQQSELIKNLNTEINILQKNLSDLGKENEFLNAKNKAFSEKLIEVRSKKETLITAIESDLLRIEEILKNENEAEDNL